MNCNAATIPNATALAPTTRASTSSRPGAALEKLRLYFRQRAERAKAARAMAVFADIDQHTLKDIGAPNWLIAQAAERERVRGLRISDLCQS